MVAMENMEGVAPAVSLHSLPNQAEGHGIPIRVDVDQIVFRHDARDPHLVPEAALAGQGQEVSAFPPEPNQWLLMGGAV